MQIILTVFGILVACSLIAVLVGPIVLDLISDDENSGEDVVSVDESIEDAFRTEAEANPNSAEASAAYANYLANTGRLAEAIPWYENAITIDPDDADIRFAFAQSLAAGGLSQDAELQFQQSIELEPANEQSHFYLAELYAEWDPPRMNEALDEYERTIEVNPDSFVAEQAAGRIDEITATEATAVASPTEERDAGT